MTRPEITRATFDAMAPADRALAARTHTVVDAPPAAPVFPAGDAVMTRAEFNQLGLAERREVVRRGTVMTDAPRPPPPEPPPVDTPIAAAADFLAEKDRRAAFDRAQQERMRAFGLPAA